MSRIIMTKGVKQYRQTIPYCINKKETVLEVVCAWGTTSNILYQYAGYVVAIDTGASLPTAKETYPHIHFEQIDGFDIARIKELNLTFTKVYFFYFRPGVNLSSDSLKRIKSQKSFQEWKSA